MSANATAKDDWGLASMALAQRLPSNPISNEWPSGWSAAACPFCACRDIRTEVTATDGSVWCPECDAKITRRHLTMTPNSGQVEALKAWNTRP